MARKSNAVTKEEANNIFELPNGDVKTPTSSTADLLKKMAGTKTTTSKSKVPIILDAALAAVADEVMVMKKEIKDLEAKCEIKEGLLITRARKDYADNKGLQASYRIQGKNGAPMITFNNKFKQIPLDSKPLISASLNGNYSKYFTDSYEISLKDTSIEKIDEVAKLIGDEKFEQLFEVKKAYIKVCPTMNNLQFELPEGVKAFVEQYKASVK